MNSQSLLEWSDRAGLAPLARHAPRGAILRNHRLCFPLYDETWSGGVADVVPEPGKSVAGTLFDMHRISLNQLDRLFLGNVDVGQNKQRSWVPMTVAVSPYTGGEPVQAVTYRLRRPDWQHVPPSTHYLERLIEAAAEFGLSWFWVMHLQSFAARDGHRRAAAADISPSAGRSCLPAGDFGLTAVAG